MNTPRISIVPSLRSLTVFGIVAACVQLAPATDVVLNAPVPTFDRWNYPFNGTVGSRPTSPSFGSIEQLQGELFDDRDGQTLITFETQGDITPGLHRGRYAISALTVTIVNKVGGLFQYDSTYDSFLTHINLPDDDPGRPLILTGVDFRNGFTPATFGETGPFPFAAPERTRNAYAAAYEAGQLIDVSNNVLDGFEVNPFAVGVAQVTPGTFVPADTTFTFAVDVNDPDIQCYLKTALRDGYLGLTISSLHFALQPGMAFVPPLVGGDLGWPEFYMKESLEVVFGLADPAGLQLSVTIQDLPFQPADTNGNGLVNIDDLVTVLNGFGQICNCCPADINDNGLVNIDDLVEVLNAFGT